MKKIKNFLVMLIISLIFLTQIYTVVQAREGNGFSIKADIGFNSTYKVGYLTPITLTIKDNVKDIQGQVQIRIPTSSTKYVSYVKELSMQKGSTKNITINVPINILSDGRWVKYSVVIVEGSKIVYKKDIEINNVLNSSTAFIGILSDDSTALNYMIDVKGPNDELHQSKIIEFNDKNFPDNESILRNMNLIVIDNFDTSKFNNAQYSALKKWVKNGGTLLIGTGNNYEKTLSIFKDTFISGSANSVSQVSTDLVNKAATKGDSSKNMKLDAAIINIKNSKPIIKDKGIALVQKLNVGEGAVGIIAFSLGEEPIYSWNNNYNFINWVIGKVENSPITTFMNTDTTSVDSYAREAMDYFSEMGSISMKGYYSILFLYVLILIPGSYVYLKKIDKRNYMWALIPLFAVGTGIIIYISGIGTSAAKITTNIVTTAFLDENGAANSNTYGEVVDGRKEKLRVQSRDGDQISYLMDPRISDSSSNQVSGSEMEGSVYPDENNSIEFDNVNIFKQKMFRIFTKDTNIGQIDADLFSDNDKFKGQITNRTRLDFENCYIVTPAEYYKIGDIKAGASTKIDVKGNIYPSASMDDFTRNVFENYAYASRKLSDKQREDIMDNNQESAMIRQLYNGRNNKGIMLLAFSKTPIHSPMIVNDRQTVKNERTLLAKEIKLNSQNNIKNYPLGTVPYSIEDSNEGDRNSGAKLINAPMANITYNIDKAIKVQKINVVTDIETKYYDIKEADYSIYNFAKKRYEKIDNKAIIGSTDISKYVNNKNEVKIQIKSSELDGDVLVPQISVSGKVK